MGLIDFVRDAGERLLKETGKGEEPDLQAIVNRLRRHDVKIDDFGLAIEDGRAIVSGTARTQEDKEIAILVIGNVKGIGQVDDQLRVAAPSASATQYYTVVRGDSLDSIAQSFYGVSDHAALLWEANRSVLDAPSRVYPGLKLRIPPLRT
ncbi:MAG: peptidoglycan-binding protein LysM [Pseudomonadota bacterium]